MTKQWILLGLILVTAFVFRFQKIGSIPPGLYPDEAINGNDAITALENHDYKLFYPNNNGREGLFINLQAISLKIFGKHVWALRIVSAIFGTLTVLGLYLLVRFIFNWQIGFLSAFMMAISFWHTVFSRIGFRAIMAPFFIVWASYFLWRGLRSSHIMNFAVSGILWGLGLYTYIGFRIMPLVPVLVILAFWYAAKKDFIHDKYNITKSRLIQGFGILIITSIIVALPIGYYFYSNPDDFIGRVAQVSVFSDGHLVTTLASNILKTLGMFNFVGDYNWRHNYSGAPLLLWPVGVFFALGLIRSVIKLFKTYKSHRHLSTIHVFLLSWFVLALLPEVLSNEGLPHALRAIQVIPVAYIFAGEGLWWLYESMTKWYHGHDPRVVTLPHGYISEGVIVATATLVVLLASLTVAEYDKYFHQWAQNPNTAQAFNQHYVDLGNYLNTLPPSTEKYVVVNAAGVLVNGIPMPAQTIMFITDTFSFAKQKAKHLFYISELEYARMHFKKSAIVVKLEE